MNHKKILIILGIVLVITVAILFFVKAKNKTDKDKTPATNTPPANPVNTAVANNNTSAPATTVANSGFPITYMKYSNAAKSLQRELGVTEDGVVGDKTLAALSSYVNVPANKLWIVYTQSELDGLIQKIRNIKAGASSDFDSPVLPYPMLYLL